MMELLKVFLFFGVLSLSTVGVAKPKDESLRFAIYDWCPYVCDSQNSQKRRGVLWDAVNEVAKKLSPLSISFEVLPFNRSLLLAKRGKVSGVVGLYRSKEREKFLQFLPTGILIRSCFFVRADSRWTFQGLESLRTMRIGHIQSHTYPGLPEDWIKYGKAIETLPGEVDQDRLARLLLLKRIDVFRGNEIPTLHSFMHLRSKNGFRKVSCHSDGRQVQLGLSRNKKGAQSSFQLFATKWKSFVDSGGVEKICQKYQLPKESC